MKNLLARFFISNALDRGTGLSRFWRKQVASSSALQEHDRALRELHDRLKETARSETVPASLHASIMRAIRSGEMEPERGGFTLVGWRQSPQLRWGLATALLLFGAMGVWFAANRLWVPAAAKASPTEIASASSLPGMGRLMDQFTTNGAAMLNGPLEEQIEAFSRNMQETARFLIASLP